mgnify:FL=1
MYKLPIGININDLIEDLKKICWEASDILLYYSQKIKDNQCKKNFIKTKDFNEPVTLADLEVNNLIIKKIKQKYLNIKWNILSEENANDVFTSKGEHDWLWVLDPLDGTKDFIQGTGNFAVHLALNYKNRPFIGFVLIPSRNQLWISNGNSTWCENRNGIKNKFQVSENIRLRDMRIITSKNHKNGSLQDLINKIGFSEIIEMGSIGCKIGAILRGDADIYISLSIPGGSAPKDWDFAAPEAVLKAAGGAITNINNQELDYNQKGFLQEGLIVASNYKNNHAKLCLEIRGIMEENNILI